MNHMMIVERYRYGGSYNALALQIPVLIVMLVIAVFVYIIRVHGNANNAFNRWVAKRVKDHKRYLYNLAKRKEYKEMKKCILVWQVPVIEGEPYNPVEYAVHVRKAKSLRKH